MAPKVVFFDMDGVTVDTAVEWRTVERTEILPAITEESIPQAEIRARSITDTYEFLADAEEYTLTVSRTEFLEQYDRWAEEIYRNRAGLLDGYRELLENVRNRGIAVGLVSASPRRWVELVLDRFELGDEFDVVLGDDDIDGESKPSPIPYLRAAESVGIDPANAIAVEDSHHGVESAVRAGMACIALRGDGNRESDLSAADLIVDDATSLRETLEARLSG
ncbi:HAD family hydrolase [Halodesulfurarchaeum sp.]|uniref:HAD family hydrolase n=1 Tax=Halodesulfurarchaeum sp. TaxID=1980530 RepID=UPI002FC2B6A8